jgi:hypothetical protein
MVFASLFIDAICCGWKLSREAGPLPKACLDLAGDGETADWLPVTSHSSHDEGTFLSTHTLRTGP